jgi:hypothetical protein
MVFSGLNKKDPAFTRSSFDYGLEPSGLLVTGTSSVWFYIEITKYLVK